jgi:hypothetical protein
MIDANVCPDCNHERSEHDLFRGCMHWNCSCMKNKGEIDYVNLLKENEELKEQAKNFKEAAEFWVERHDALYEKYKKFGEGVDVRIDVIEKKFDWMADDYRLMRDTLQGIIDDFVNPNMTYFNVFSRAFNCLYKIAKNKEERENE